METLVFDITAGDERIRLATIGDKAAFVFERSNDEHEGELGRIEMTAEQLRGDLEMLSPLQYLEFVEAGMSIKVGPRNATSFYTETQDSKDTHPTVVCLPVKAITDALHAAARSA